MTPFRWQKIEIALALLAILLIVVFLHVSPEVLDGKLPLALCVLVLVAMAVGKRMFWRCPHCKRLLPTRGLTIHAKTVCPHCEKPLAGPSRPED